MGGLYWLGGGRMEGGWLGRDRIGLCLWVECAFLMSHSGLC